MNCTGTPLASTRHRAPAWAADKLRGFTLVELMITLFVAAILLTIAIPSFRGVISRTNLGSIHNELISTLRYARTEAASRGVAIAVAASAGGWKEGWTVEVPASGSTAAVPLRSVEALDPRYEISAEPAATARIEFDAQGAADDTVCFTVKDSQGGASSKPLYVEMLPSGAVHSLDATAIPPNC